MAVRINANNEDYSRTTNVPPEDPLTMMVWFYLVTARTGINTYALLHTDGSANGMFLSFETNGTMLEFLGLTAGTPAPTDMGTLATATWYHIAFTRSGSAINAYIDGAVVASPTFATTYTEADISVGGHPVDTTVWADARYAACKVWRAALSTAEIQQEMRQYMPVRTANLDSFYPFLSVADDEVDYSGNGRNWTVGGTPTTEDGPPIPWRAGRQRCVVHRPARAFPFLVPSMAHMLVR